MIPPMTSSSVFLSNRVFLKVQSSVTHRTGWTMSSGLYDLITGAASLVQNT